MASIVVPAHQEERVIGRCLTSLVGQLGADDEIVVVCNGCSDRTAEIARSFGPPVRVAEIPQASKIAALNRGDDLAGSFPRLYVDADVELSDGAVGLLAEALQDPDAELVAPAARHDVTASSRWVRAYYRIWSQLPSVRDETVARGVYALSEQGRGRFGRFPNVTGDDHYVRDLVEPARRRVVWAAQSTVRAPRTLRGLLRVKSRAFGGNRALDEQRPEAHARYRRRRREWLGVVRRNPRLLPVVPLYLLVSTWPRLVVAVRRFRGAGAVWDRDDTSRE